jgi:hypothetical protein
MNRLKNKDLKKSIVYDTIRNKAWLESNIHANNILCQYVWEKTTEETWKQSWERIRIAIFSEIYVKVLDFYERIN